MGRDPDRAYRYLILNGFDRSGSSMVASVLAKHPAIESLFQPFSGTEVHRTQWEPWTETTEAPATAAFLTGLLGGRLDRDYLGSDWAERFSSTLEPRPGALHVIKDTKLHLKVRWLRSNFPEIPVWGLYRDLRGIVASLVRNGFHERWYGGAFEAVRPLVEADPSLESRYGRFFDGETSPGVRMAVVVAVRTEGMAGAVAAPRWIRYERVLADPNAELGRILAAEGLEPFDFEPFMGRDYNVVGKPPVPGAAWREVLSPEDADVLAGLDAELRDQVAGGAARHEAR